MPTVLDKNGERLAVGDRVRRCIVPKLGVTLVEGAVIAVHGDAVRVEFVRGRPVDIPVRHLRHSPYRCGALERIEPLQEGAGDEPA